MFSGDRYAMSVEWRDAATEGRLDVQKAEPAIERGEGATPLFLTRVDRDALLALVRQRIGALHARRFHR